MSASVHIKSIWWLLSHIQSNSRYTDTDCQLESLNALEPVQITGTRRFRRASGARLCSMFLSFSVVLFSVKVTQSHYRPGVAQRVPGGWGSQISRQLEHKGRLYYPVNIPGSNCCWRLSRPQGHSAAGRIMSMKNFSDTNGNRTRNLPACSAVPQPTAPPGAPPLFVDCKIKSFRPKTSHSATRNQFFQFTVKPLSLSALARRPPKKFLTGVRTRCHLPWYSSVFCFCEKSQN